MTGWVDKACFK